MTARPEGAVSDHVPDRGPVTVAAIDCGTNSVRLLVATTDAAGRLAPLRRVTTITRLGQGVDATGEFHPDALARTFAAFEAYAAEIEAVGGVDRVRIVATSAARDARNRDDFFAGALARLGVEPQVIAGDEEARLSFTGAVAGIPDALDPVLVVDIGGGSTELIRGVAADIESSQSLDIGAVRLRERFLHGDPPTPAQISAARAHVTALLDAGRVSLEGVATFIGVAGTATTMAAVDMELPAYDRTLVHRHAMSVDTIATTAERWLTSTIEQVRLEPSMHPQRAEVICGGALILDAIARRVGTDLVVSESDILDGIAMQLLG